MTSGHELFLHENLFLLALDEERGTLAPKFGALGIKGAFATGGALMAELVLQGRVSIEQQVGGSPRVSVANSTPIGDPLLDMCLELLQRKKARSLQEWITKFAEIHGLHQRIAGQLCERGILWKEERRMLLVFTRRTYPTRDGRPRRKLLEEMRWALRTEDKAAPRIALILALASRTELLHQVAGRRELPALENRIEQLVSKDVVARETQAAFDSALAFMGAFTSTGAWNTSVLSANQN